MKALKDLTPDDVMSVYSGRNGRCCCGCSGNHRYNSKYRDAAGKRRGYELDDEDVSDYQVRRVLKIVQREPRPDPDLEHTQPSNHYSAVIGQRLYVVYPLEVNE